MKLYEKITLLRKRNGFSQEDLADKLNISRQSVYKWEQGVSVPELDKLKKIASIFGVSMDMLLDDTVDIVRPEVETAKAPAYRKVFNSGNAMELFYASFEHGYVDEKKRKRKDKGAFWKEMEGKYKKLLATRRYDYVARIQHNATPSFFADEKNCVCGFIFDGCEQFVCPIENIIDVSVYDDGQATAQTRPIKYTLNISYFDIDGTTKSYSISFNTRSSHYVWYEYEKAISKKGAYELYRNKLSAEIRNSLMQVRDKIISLRAKGEKVKSGEISVTQPDLQMYAAAAKNSAQIHKNVKNILVAKAKKENLIHTLIIVGVAAVVVTGIILIGVLC